MTKGKYIRTPEIIEKYRLSHAGKKLSESTKKKISASNIGKNKPMLVGENNTRWNPHRVYEHSHKWMYDNFGKPNYCEDCKTTVSKVFDWANISGEYKLEREDWKRLCRKCHVKFDDVANKSWNIKRLKEITS